MVSALAYSSPASVPRDEVETLPPGMSRDDRQLDDATAGHLLALSGYKYVAVHDGVAF